MPVFERREKDEYGSFSGAASCGNFSFLPWNGQDIANGLSFPFFSRGNVARYITQRTGVVPLCFRCEQVRHNNKRALDAFLFS